MELNADFSQRVVVDSSDLEWIPSPMPGVERRMLDRIGGEVARATSVVRYAPKSHFSAHTHSGGEEFLVLEGVFQDEHGDFPVGTYVRNPPTSEHTPGSEVGCTILVKLWQFDPEDRTHVRIDTSKSFYVADATRPGVHVLPLFQDDRETVALETWERGSRIALDYPGGAELFVLDGEFQERNDSLGTGSWLRLPAGTKGTAEVTQRANLWVKTGHLRDSAFSSPSPLEHS